MRYRITFLDGRDAMEITAEQVVYHQDQTVSFYNQRMIVSRGMTDQWGNERRVARNVTVAVVSGIASVIEIQDTNPFLGEPPTTNQFVTPPTMGERTLAVGQTLTAAATTDNTIVYDEEWTTERDD